MAVQKLKNHEETVKTACEIAFVITKYCYRSIRKYCPQCYHDVLEDDTRLYFD